MKNTGITRAASRGLLYLALALAFLAAFAFLFWLSVYTGFNIPRLWGAFAMWTAVLCCIVAKMLRAHWAKSRLWMGIAFLLGIHLIIFIPLLRNCPQWRPVWFVPVVVFEAVLWDALLGVVLARGTK